MLAIKNNIKPKNYKKAMQYIRWQEVIKQKVDSKWKNNTWI